MNSILQRLALASFAALLTTAAPAQDRPLALINARIVTMDKAGTIESGTVLVSDGTIDAIGEDVKIPAGAEVIDVEGGTIMPGLVHAWSRAGLNSNRPRGGTSFSMQRGGRRSFRTSPSRSRGGSASNKAATKIASSIYARQDIFGDLLEKGVTTLVVRPDGTGFPGMAARLDPSAKDQDGLIMDDAVFTLVQPAATDAAKKMLKDAFDKAKAVVEERKKPKEAPKKEEPAKPDAKKEAAKPEAKPDGEKKKEGEEKKEGEKGGTPPKDGEKKPAEQKKPEAKPTRRPAPKKDPNVEVIADVFEAKRKSFLRLSSAMEVQHYFGGIGDHRYPTTIIADSTSSTRGRLDQILDKVKELKAPVMMQPSLDTMPYTQILVNPPALLHNAGVEVGFLLSDNPSSVGSVFFSLMEIVRHGMPADAALAAVTKVPAKALGLDGEVGSLSEGKRADLLVFNGDPLDPASQLETVYYAGRPVHGDN